MGYGGYWGFAPYVSVAEKRAKAARKLKELMKNNADIQPITIEGRTIARTWWGKAWNDNLESYADYSNRIGRGRSYVRNGALLDLKIAPGKVESLVQGTRSEPYSVTIRIKPIDKKIWRHIRDSSQGKIGSMQELLAGRFPKDLGELFTVQGKGLFPTPKEIEFQCSCPDWAYMCKHVAATLYGIGARLDHEPALFFTLRHAEIRDLLTEAVRERTRRLLEKAKGTTGRVIAEADVAEVFGIDLEEPAAPVGQAKASVQEKPESRDRRTAVRRSVGKTRKGAVVRSPVKTRKVAAKRPQVTPPETEPGRKRRSGRAPSPREAKTPFERVAEIVSRSRKGVTVAEIREKTGLKEQQIRNAITRARQKGLIAILSRGLYGAVPRPGQRRSGGRRLP